MNRAILNKKITAKNIFWFPSKSMKIKMILDHFLQSDINVTLFYDGSEIVETHPALASSEIVNHQSISEDFLNPYESEELGLYNAFMRGDFASRYMEALYFELNRSNSFDNLRFLERSHTARSLIFFWLRKYLKHGPTLVLFSEAPHNPIQLAAKFAADFLDIDQVWFQSTEPFAPFVLPRTSHGILPVDFMPHRDNDLHNSALQIMEDSIDAMISGTKTPRVRAAEVQKKTSQRIREKLTESLITNVHLNGDKKDRGPLDAFPKLVKKGNSRTRLGMYLINLELRKMFRKSFYGGLSNAPVDKYVYFPLHFQPERTSIPEGPLVPFQPDLLAKAREFVAESHLLVVKEHPGQIARPFGFHGRSPLNTGFISQINGCQIANPNVDSRTLIAGSSLVITISGTSGLQGLLQGKKVGYFGEPWWQGAPGTFKLPLNGQGRWVEDSELYEADSKISITKEFLSNRAKSGFLGLLITGRENYFSQIFSREEVDSIRTQEAEAIVSTVLFALRQPSPET